MRRTSVSNIKGRTAEGNHHSFASRDYESLPCHALGCIWNMAHKNQASPLKECGLPSRCKIGDDGKCQGFEGDAPIVKVDGD